ncbi:hypothetical protein [Spirosoma litoris]
MENTINLRINQVMEREKMNINTFSKTLNKSYTAINSIVKGLSKPGWELLEAIISNFPDINPGWLMTGEGEMIKQVAPAIAPSSAPDSYLVEHLHTLEENFARLASQLESKDKQIETLTRLLEVSMTQKASEKSFLNGTSFEGRVIPFTPVKNEKATA